MSKQAFVDVLIIGAGPAGLMCAKALTAAGINVRIIDKSTLKVGQADGVTPRTIEVLQSYGLLEHFMRKGKQVYMNAFYKSDHNGGIKCVERRPVVNDASARYPFGITLHQAGVEAIFIDSVKNHGVEIERPKQPSSLEISQDIDELSSISSYPVKVTVEDPDAIDDDTRKEIIYAKFVVGADGAHSWVRKTLGIDMEGEQTEYIWGVFDAALETNFPDTHNLVTIHAENGSCLIIPREGDKNRVYIQLSDADVIDPVTGRVDKNRVNPEKLVSLARKVLRPYVLADPKYIEWWTVYIIGQRIASSYSAKGRVFIVGDACHTHSPKAGQGMNAALNDAHNLGWKLAQVLKGWSSPSLLKTYGDERRKFAQDLINMDKQIVTLFSQQAEAANDENEPHPKLLLAFKAHQSFTMGISIQYPPSAIVNTKHQQYAENLVIGQRMLPQIFVRAANTHPIDIHDLLPADGRFKILFFVGDLTPARMNELNSFAEELSTPASFLLRYGAEGLVSTVFDVITIVAGKKGDVNFLTVPTLLRPHWSKVLLDDTDSMGRCGGGAYERFGIDSNQITVVVVRPDGYVGTIVPSTAIADLDQYFGSFMVPPRGSL